MTGTDAPLPGWDWHIVHDANMIEPCPQFLDGDGPYDLTGLTIQLHIRPTWDFADPIAVLTSSGGGAAITIDNHVDGLITVSVPQATVETWPVGSWQFFLRGSDASSNWVEFARGPFFIHPGNDTP